MTTNQKLWLKIVAYIAIFIAIIVFLHEVFFPEKKQGDSSGSVGIPVQNIAPKYNVTINLTDAKTLEKKTQKAEYYLQGEATPTQATLIYKFDGEYGEWRGTIVFNPSTLRGSFREEYPAMMPKFGTVTVKPHYTGGFELTFTYDKEVVSYQALFLPVWW